MASRFSIEAVFKAIDKVTAPVRRMQNRVGKFTRSMQRGFIKLDRAVSKMATGIKRMARTGAVAFVAMGFALKNLLTSGAAFEQAITNVGAVSLRTRDQIKPLEQLALKLGKTTKFTATQSANAMEIMARAGFTVNEILSATPAVLAAAAASGLEIAEVAGVVSNALKGMGLEASQAGEVADVLALASAKTNSTIGSLGESLKNVASTARQLDIPLTETVATIALLQDVGLDASVAGSAFNVMLTKMAAPTVGMQKKMKKLGITFKDVVTGDMLPLRKVLEQLNVASAKVGGNFDKVAFLAELVGLRGQKAAANLGKLFEEGKLDKLVEQLENAKGSAKAMAKIKMDTVSGSFLLLESAVDAVKTKIFNLQSGPLKKLIDRMRTWLGENENIIASKIGEFLLDLIENIKTIVTWIKNIGIALAVFFALSAAIKVATASMAIFNFVIGLNPLTRMITLITAAIAALIALDRQFQVTERIGGAIGEGLFNLFNEQYDPNAADTNTISPQERIARTISEQRTTNTSEVKLTTDNGTSAEVTSGKLGGGLTLQDSGAF